jgi:hypothetical protein
MAVALILAVAAVATVVWFFVTRTPEHAASHEDPVEGEDRKPEQSHFAPGDPGAEG